MQKLDLPYSTDNTVGIETQILDILEVNDKEFRDNRDTKEEGCFIQCRFRLSPRGRRLHSDP